MINANSIVINPHLRKVNYDPLTSDEPHAYLLILPQVIVVNSDAPYRTLAEFITDARAKPGQLTFATVGPATTQHRRRGSSSAWRTSMLSMCLIGGAPAMTALLGGHVNAVLANYSEVQEQLQAGKVRALASTSQTRIAPAARRASVAELGYKNYNVEVWFGVLARSTTAQYCSAPSPTGSVPRSTRRRSHRGSSSSVFIRLALASTTSPHTSVANTTNTVALSARQTLRANSIR